MYHGIWNAILYVLHTCTLSVFYFLLCLGACGNDGFYHNGYDSFTICSNGNAYHQRCAPGSRNSGNSHYTKGSYYSHSDFCDVNLVDHGYGAHKGYGPHKGFGSFRGFGYH